MGKGHILAMVCGIVHFGQKGLVDYNPLKLENFGCEFCPQGPRMAAQCGTSNDGVVGP